MSFISNMPRRGSVYYFRRRVPPDLQAILGTKVIRESLHERDPAKARRLNAERAVFWERRFEEERAKLNAPAPTLPAISQGDLQLVSMLHMAEVYGIDVQWEPGMKDRARAVAARGTPVANLGEDLIQEMVVAFERETLVHDELWRMFGYSQKEDGISDRDFAIHGTVIESWEKDTAERIARGRHMTPQQRSKIDLMLLERGLRLDPASPAYRRLAVEVSNAEARAYAALAARQAGRPAPTPPAATAPPVLKKVTAQELLDGWKLERKPKAKTFDSFKSKLLNFERSLGGRSLEMATPKDAANWKAARLKAVSNKSVVTDVDAVKAVLGWASENHRIPSNPFAGMKVARDKSPTPGRRSTTDEETTRILLHVRGDTGYRKWIPWLAAFTGARISELAQLHVDDVRGDILGEFVLPYLDINTETPDKSVKTFGSIRKVPLHPQLIEEGFLTFVKSKTSGPLFDDLKPDRYGARGGTASRKIGIIVRDEIGITDKKLAPSHSFRHRFKTACRNVGIPKDVHDCITGHLVGDASEKYGDRAGIVLLSAEIAKLKWVQLPADVKGDNEGKK